MLVNFHNIGFIENLLKSKSKQVVKVQWLRSNGSALAMHKRKLKGGVRK